MVADDNGQEEDAIIADFKWPHTPSKGPATLHDSTQLDRLVELSWGQS